jgi:hypothetical protein
MSTAVFQSLMARLVIDPAWRASVREQGLPEDADLSGLERRRLNAIAASAGLDTNQTLHKGFRLGKIKALLPLTTTLLKGDALQVALSAFWAQHPPKTFYFLPEAVEFCDFLLARPSTCPYLHEVAAFERAHLELQRARTGEPEPQTVTFVHNPSQLLGPLAHGRQPVSVERRSCTATGVRDAKGQAQWTLQE